MPLTGVFLLGSRAGDPLPGFSADLFEYNALNQLITVRNSNGIATYNYKPDGLRHSKAISGETTTHTWDGAFMILDGDNAYIRGIGLIRQRGGDYFLFNGRGDVVALVDSNGLITREYRFLTSVSSTHTIVSCVVASPTSNSKANSF